MRARRSPDHRAKEKDRERKKEKSKEKEWRNHKTLPPPPPVHDVARENGEVVSPQKGVCVRVCGEIL